MLRKLLRCKIHRAVVTGANLDYEGSITLDQNLIEEAGLLPFEAVDIYNISNGHRFETYVISGEPGSGKIEMNGAAAHLAKPGDLIIIACYGYLPEGEIPNHKPKIILVDSKNRVVERKQLQTA